MSVSRVYDEVIDFIAESNPARVISFHPSEVAQARVAELVAREKEDLLSLDETSELDHYLQLEHIMRLAKARARKYLVSK